MKKLTLSCMMLLCTTFLYINVHAQGVTTPVTASPKAIVGQTIGISNVTITYSRPSVKGRKVWGELVPFGYTPIANGNQAPWRAGANENTVIELSDEATIEGTKVPAGKYGLFFVINADNSAEVILSKDSKAWGHFFYEQKNDQMRAPVKVREGELTEMLTYNFINSTKNSSELVLRWERKEFPVKIEFAVDEIVMANANAELKGIKGFTWQGYSSAAAYAAANKVNLDQAQKWIDQAININRSFGTLQVKSNVLRAVNNSAEAEKVMKEALTLGNENELNAYGYALLGAGSHDQAIEVFTLITTKYPGSANAFDSLGEGYFTKGDNKSAIKYFKKALTLNPPPATKINSEKYLKQLGAL